MGNVVWIGVGFGLGLTWLWGITAFAMIVDADSARKRRASFVSFCFSLLVMMLLSMVAKNLC